MNLQAYMDYEYEGFKPDPPSGPVFTILAWILVLACIGLAWISS